VLFTPPGGPAWHGGRERQAFARLAGAGPSPAETEALCRVILTGLLPALAAADLEAFGDSVHEFNARVGDAFAAAQGGRYGSAAVAGCVARLRAAGVRGVGQSSWGPTVFAVTRRTDADRVRSALMDVPAVIASGSDGATVG
jgi:predicted sugar kinase